MHASHPDRSLIPQWLIQWAVPALIGVVMLLADRRISALETRLVEQEKARQTFDLQYVQDRSTIMEGQRQILHDMRVLCGSKSANVPCPEEP